MIPQQAPCGDISRQATRESAKSTPFKNAQSTKLNPTFQMSHSEKRVKTVLSGVENKFFPHPTDCGNSLGDGGLFFVFMRSCVCHLFCPACLALAFYERNGAIVDIHQKRDKQGERQIE